MLLVALVSHQLDQAEPRCHAVVGLHQVLPYGLYELEVGAEIPGDQGAFLPEEPFDGMLFRDDAGVPVGRLCGFCLRLLADYREERVGRAVQGLVTAVASGRVGCVAGRPTAAMVIGIKDIEVVERLTAAAHCGDFARIEDYIIPLHELATTPAAPRIRAVRNLAGSPAAAHVLVRRIGGDRQICCHSASRFRFWQLASRAPLGRVPENAPVLFAIRTRPPGNVNLQPARRTSHPVL